jgi:hypothetical protein
MLKTVKAEKIYSKEFEYEKDGQKRKFTKYSAKADGIYYVLQGKGRDSVKEGDEVTGNYYTKDYLKKDNTQGTEHIIELLDGAMVTIFDEIRQLKERMDKLDSGSVPTKQINTKEPNDDLPF